MAASPSFGKFSEFSLFRPSAFSSSVILQSPPFFDPVDLLRQEQISNGFPPILYALDLPPLAAIDTHAGKINMYLWLSTILLSTPPRRLAGN